MLAPSTDVGLVIGFLFWLLRWGCYGLSREFIFALFNKSRKLDCSIVRNFDARRGTSNPQGCDWGVDLHIASLRDTAGNECECSLGQIEQSRIGLPIRVVHELVQSHAGVAR